MATLEQRMYNLITAVQLAEFNRDKGGWPTIDGNAVVLIHTCALDYQKAGGTKWKLEHNYNGPALVLANPDAEY